MRRYSEYRSPDTVKPMPSTRDLTSLEKPLMSDAYASAVSALDFFHQPVVLPAEPSHTPRTVEISRVQTVEHRTVGEHAVRAV
jgi:hypothetical protein